MIQKALQERNEKHAKTGNQWVWKATTNDSLYLHEMCHVWQRERMIEKVGVVLAWFIYYGRGFLGVLGFYSLGLEKEANEYNTIPKTNN